MPSKLFLVSFSEARILTANWQVTSIKFQIFQLFPITTRRDGLKVTGYTVVYEWSKA